MPKRLSTLLLSAALLAGAFAAAAPVKAASEEEKRVWASATSCREVVELEHGRMAPAAAARLRVAAWNIEWFPDHTDIGWLACAIAWMNLDLLGVVEIRDGESARAQMGELLAALERLTGAPWQVDLQRCGARSSQHVGFLWNAARLRLLAAEHITVTHACSIRTAPADPQAHAAPGGWTIRLDWAETPGSPGRGLARHDARTIGA